MSTTDQTTEQAVDPTADQAVDQPPVQAVEENGAAAADLGYEPTLTLDLALSEAEALRTWLLKPAQDGTTSLDDQLVSRALTKLGLAIDAVLAAANVRRELLQAGLPVDHLSDEQVCELGYRVAQAAAPGIRH